MRVLYRGYWIDSKSEIEHWVGYMLFHSLRNAKEYIDNYGIRFTPKRIMEKVTGRLL